MAQLGELSRDIHALYRDVFYRLKRPRTWRSCGSTSQRALKTLSRSRHEAEL